MDEKREFVLSVTATMHADAVKMREARLSLFEGELSTVLLGDIAVHTEVLSVTSADLLIHVQTTQKHTLIYNGREATLPLCEGARFSTSFSFANGEKITVNICLLRMCTEASA